VLVRASFEANHQRYGSPRIHEDLLEQRRGSPPQVGQQSFAHHRHERHRL
jgi:hypothetical protein